MKILFLTILIALQLSFSPQKIGGWRGIVPLHSTRADVERLFGSSTTDCKCVYKVPDGVIHVEYAVDRCKGVLPGWNVPADTILRFTVRPTVQQNFSDLQLDIERYTVRRDDTFTTYYANREEGIEYAVLPNGIVNSVSYVPSTRDDGLGCSGFAPQAGLTNYVPFDGYGDLDFNTERGRLDTFAIALDQRANLTGYIVVYAGKVACPEEAKSRGNRARAYLISKRGLRPTRVVAVDGGYRKNFSVELYAVPQNADPPRSLPTLAPSEIRIVKSRRCL